MIVLSLFDGISCGRVALERAGIPVAKYYAAEIDNNAIKISKHNCPDIIRLGDVTKWKTWNIPKPDIILAGSPCTTFSNAGKGAGFNGISGSMYHQFLDIYKHYQPDYFLLENVKMKLHWEASISQDLGYLPITINSSLVSAQQRKRLYWTNIPKVQQPTDKKIYLKDIIESGYVNKDKSYCIDANYYKGISLQQYLLKNRRQLVFEKPQRLFSIGHGGQGNRVYDARGKSITLTAGAGGLGGKTGLYLTKDFTIRKLTIKECERLQTLPDGYCEDVLNVSNTQKYRALGNGWTVDVISHILSHI